MLKRTGDSRQPWGTPSVVLKNVPTWCSGEWHSCTMLYSPDDNSSTLWFLITCTMPDTIECFLEVMNLWYMSCWQWYCRGNVDGANWWCRGQAFINQPSPYAIESHPTPLDSRGSFSPSRSIPGIPSHVADGGTTRIPLESVHPYLPWSSVPLFLVPFILPSIMSSPIPPALTTCPCSSMQPLSPLTCVHSGLMLSMIDMLVFLSIHDTLSTLLQHHNSKASIFLLSCFLIVQVSAPYSINTLKQISIQLCWSKSCSFFQRESLSQTQLNRCTPTELLNPAMNGGGRR